MYSNAIQLILIHSVYVDSDLRRHHTVVSEVNVIIKTVIVRNYCPMLLDVVGR